MTLVVYNKGIIAADRINSSSGHILGTVKKFAVSSCNTKVAAGAGIAATIQRFLKWFEGDRTNPFIDFSKDEYEGKERTASCCVFEYTNNKHYVTVYSTLGQSHYEMIDGVFALGIAEEYATGAMLAGAAINKVFEIAHKMTPIVGLEYDYHILDLS